MKCTAEALFSAKVVFTWDSVPDMVYEEGQWLWVGSVSISSKIVTEKGVWEDEEI